jgi:hypothetical protein
MVAEASRKMLDIRVKVKHQLFFSYNLLTIFIFLNDEWGVK